MSYSTTTRLPRTSNVFDASFKASIRASTASKRCTAWDIAGANNRTHTRDAYTAQMSLRTRLLVLSLLTLVLPWAGREYARQMEGVLRSGQEAALLTTAKTLARVIVTDNELVEQSFVQHPSGESTSGHYFAAQLTTTPL